MLERIVIKKLKVISVPFCFSLIVLFGLRYYIFNEKPDAPSKMFPTDIKYTDENNVYRIVRDLCPNLLKTQYPQPEAVLATRNRFQDLLVVIVFNLKHHEAIPYLEAIYRIIFPNILYCGQGDLPKEIRDSFKITYLRYDDTPKGMFPGALNYECMGRAIDRGYEGIKDYLFLSDDIMLNYWNMEKLPRGQAWFQSGAWPKHCGILTNILSRKTCENVTKCDNKEDKDLESEYHKAESGQCWKCAKKSGWMWWTVNKAETINALKELESSNESAIHRCHQHSLFSHGSNYVIPGILASDIYYIPEKYSKLFSRLSKVFKKHKVFLEIAVPLMCNCFESMDIVALSGHGYWSKRGEPWVHYPKELSNVYFHPSKLGPIKKGSKQHIDYFCNMVYPNITYNVNLSRQ